MDDRKTRMAFLRSTAGRTEKIIHSYNLSQTIRDATTKAALPLFFVMCYFVPVVVVVGAGSCTSGRSSSSRGSTIRSIINLQGQQTSFDASAPPSLAPEDMCDRELTSHNCAGE